MNAAPTVECVVESDAELAARFEREAMPHYAVLLRAARRLTRSETEAEDLVQDTLTNAYLGFRRFRSGTNARAWLFCIMRNRWISCHRMKQRRPASCYVDEITDRDLAGSASHSTREGRSAEDEALDSLLDRELREAVQSLPDGFQKVLYYTGVEGRTYAETAVLLEIPLGTVMSRISRGRARLRTKLAEYNAVSRSG
ncbi:sigma-70 family RNA polymerase sigma factor [Mycobacterium sp. NPDC003449]